MHDGPKLPCKNWKAPREAEALWELVYGVTSLFVSGLSLDLHPGAPKPPAPMVWIRVLFCKRAVTPLSLSLECQHVIVGNKEGLAHFACRVRIWESGCVEGLGCKGFSS